MEELKHQTPLLSIKSKNNLQTKVIGKSCFWLDPNQQEILNNKNPTQIIIGPASTGKTILIQLKVLEILENVNNTENILTLLPN